MDWTTYAHKISLVYNGDNDTFYMYYCAVATKPNGIDRLPKADTVIC